MMNVLLDSFTSMEDFSFLSITSDIAKIIASDDFTYGNMNAEDIKNMSSDRWI